ncbi:MAG: hypothetical protein PVH12_07580, partial [Candidatus Bathyarchaeota archaeon]
PIPFDLDGRVLNEVFSENSKIAQRDAKRSFTSSKSLREQYSLSEEEKESLRKRLKELGYF